jgi:soluble lytic murein transglycosylase-like protein
MSLIEGFFAALLATTPAPANTTDAMLDAAAKQHGVPAHLVRGVAWVESRKRCGAKNGQYRGIMQVGRAAAREVGVPYPFRSCRDEIEAGVRYLKVAISKGGEGCAGVSLYQSGHGKKPRCTNYGKKVMRAAEKENG